MTNKIKPAFNLLIFLMFLQCANGQVQKNMTDYLTQKFLRYSRSVPREEIFIHSDREEYIAGEDLWFNIYLTDRQTFKPSLNSRIVYFELLNFENRPVIQERIFINKGFGPGQITLPDTLSSGQYTIRAYTSWMKNFLPYNCFTKDIKVYNAFNNKTFKGKVNLTNASTGVNSNETTTGFLYTGFNINANNLISENLELSITADANFRTQNSNHFYLFIQTHGKIDYINSESIASENSKILIPKKVLTEGINQITAFDLRGQPIYERFIYTPGKEKTIAITAPDSCNVRSKISLGIDIGKELSDTLFATNLSVSVAPVLNAKEIMDLNDYLIFGSEFGTFSWNTLNGRKISQLPAEIMDSLLVNVKSNWINWRTILADDLPVFKYQFETKYQYIFGKMYNRDQKASSSGEFILLSTPGKQATFQYARTDDKGNFSLRVHIDDGLKDLVIQPDDISKNSKIIIESSFSDQYQKSKVMIDTADKQIPPYVSILSVNYQVRKIYEWSSVGDPVNRSIPQIQPKRFYGKPDVELKMADYIKLPVMQEVFFELMPGVALKAKKSSYEITILDPVDKKFLDKPPVLMVDGVVINDASIIANLDPELVEEIDSYKQKYFVGDYLFYGLVNVITKAGNYSSVILPNYAMRIPYRVIDPLNYFKSPDYSLSEMKRSRIPDFRNTLYWNPSVKTDKEGKAGIEFWSSDNTTDYMINIQGITSNGKMISLRKILKVK